MSWFSKAGTLGWQGRCLAVKFFHPEAKVGRLNLLILTTALMLSVPARKTASDGKKYANWSWGVTVLGFGFGMTYYGQPKQTPWKQGLQYVHPGRVLVCRDSDTGEVMDVGLISSVTKGKHCMAVLADGARISVGKNALTRAPG